MPFEFHPFDYAAALDGGVKVLLGLLGMLLGQVLCRLPVWLFLRGEPRLTRRELGEAMPEKRRAADAALAAALLWFLVFGAFLGATTDLHKDGNWFFLLLVGFGSTNVPVSVFELATRVSVLLSFGRGARGGPLRFIVSPRAAPAGVFRLLFTAPLVVGFLMCR